MSQSKSRVIIVGAGLAGLACAVHMRQAGVEVLLLEADSDVGGRVRTDELDGFLLDRGFQVLLSDYPEAQRVLDLGALDLRALSSGALVRARGRMRRIADPLREPSRVLSTLFSGMGSAMDKWRVLRLKQELQALSLEEIFRRPERTTSSLLQERGFSPAFIDEFFRPFFGGIFLESELTTSSRMFEFVFRAFGRGQAVVPAAGMGQISQQLASRLSGEQLRLGAKVVEVDAGGVRLEDGTAEEAEAVVVATEGDTAAQWVPEVPAPSWCPVRCLYYAAGRSPLREAILVLNGEGEGPINNLCVPSDVSPKYAPSGKSLVSVSVLGNGHDDEATIDSRVREQLLEWFGAEVRDWTHLRTYSIQRALPKQAPPVLDTVERTVATKRGIFVTGDHRETASSQGALHSGRRAAVAVLAALRAS